jgi:hypothetical protein
VRSRADQQPAGLGPDFLEANIPGPTPGRFAPVPASPPGQASPDPPGPALPATTAPGSGGPGDGGSGSSGSRWTIPTPVKDIRSGPFETVARGLLRAAGGLLNRRVQVDDDDASFLPDAEDDKMFAPAAGRIAARHMPLPDKADLSELEDIGAAAVALLNWAAKGLIAAWDARASRRRAKAALKGAGAAVYAGGPGEMEDQAQ